MSVRLEWSLASVTRATVLVPGEEAGDGQTAQSDHYTLVIGSQAIGGTKTDLLEMLSRAMGEVMIAPEMISDEIAAAWLDIYEHAIPDPEEYDDDHVPLEDREKFEKALEVIHQHMSKRRA